MCSLQFKQSIKTKFKNEMWQGLLVVIIYLRFIKRKSLHEKSCVNKMLKQTLDT